MSAPANAARYEPIRRSWTVWDCESPASGQRVRIVRVSEPDDHAFAHQYQRIAWRGLALTRDEAMRIAAVDAPAK